jgi:hypothetical protein
MKKRALTAVVVLCLVVAATATAYDWPSGIKASFKHGCVHGLVSAVPGNLSLAKEAKLAHAATWMCGCQLKRAEAAIPASLIPTHGRTPKWLRQIINGCLRKWEAGQS